MRILLFHLHTASFPWRQIKNAPTSSQSDMIERNPERSNWVDPAALIGSISFSFATADRTNIPEIRGLA
jgi:hypothetical protein